MGNVHAASNTAPSPNVPAPPITTVPVPAPPSLQPQPETPILAPVDTAVNPGTFEDLHKQCKGNDIKDSQYVKFQLFCLIKNVSASITVSLVTDLCNSICNT